MKKRILAVCLLVALCLTACSGMSVSDGMYREVRDHVLQSADTIAHQGKTTFFEYKTTGFFLGGVYYGYYYTPDDAVLLPEFYTGSDADAMRNDRRAADGGEYFGRPNNGTDWCFVRKIADGWYYYELHWA